MRIIKLGIILLMMMMFTGCKTTDNELPNNDQPMDDTQRLAVESYTGKAEQLLSKLDEMPY